MEMVFLGTEASVENESPVAKYLKVSCSFNLLDTSAIVVSIFAFRLLISNDNKCEGLSNLNGYSIIYKPESLSGSKVINVESKMMVN